MFSRLIGNDNVKITLRRLLKSGRVPNSALFSGDEGVGKLQFALELARSLICPESEEGEACGVCSVCRRVGKFTFPKPDSKDDHKRVIFSDHPDVGMVIAYNRNILIDAIRHLESEANYHPYEASARFLIVDNADKMNAAASNALLKTLEEPAPTSFIFLITSRPDSLLPTIRSRCQSIRFAPIPTGEIERFLIEDRAYSHDEARIAARLARGSIGAAITVNVEQFRARRERMIGVLRSAIRDGDLAAVLTASEEMNGPKEKEAFEDSINILQSLIHDVWALTVTGDPERLINNDNAEELVQLAASAGNSDLEAWISAIDDLRANLIVNINKRVAADALFVSMAVRE